MAKETNRRILLASRPEGAPQPDNFKLEEADRPSAKDGEVLIRNLWLSLDPYMRGRMSDAPSYVPPFDIGEPLGGGTVGRIEESKADGFSKGDLVLAMGGWQDYAVESGKSLRKLEGMDKPSLALSLFGMPGFTAWHGLLKIGQPKKGETVVVAAASGPVGSVVGQIAKLKGCRVVGIAGGKDKCRLMEEEFGFDACLDRHDDDFEDQLKKAVPDGIDVYFENVGGAVFQAVLPLLNVHARVPVCGLVASYNATSLPDGPDRTPVLMGNLLKKRILMRGFIIFDHYADEFSDFFEEMTGWVKDGKVKIREDVTEGLENAPEAFIGLLEGKNTGKLVVEIAKS